MFFWKCSRYCVLSLCAFHVCFPHIHSYRSLYCLHANHLSCSFMISILLWADDFINGVTQGHHKWIFENFAMFTFEMGTNRNCCESESVRECGRMYVCVCVYRDMSVWGVLAKQAWVAKGEWGTQMDCVCKMREKVIQQNGLTRLQSHSTTA